eukprot:CAMPEP_0181113782 /NCGR_PEP_ID=MMETSP1071-20121207/20529_1 /TAXON_ID=35127 /ORGANISM="Thalassiosira sp., Strain NH16" /LENGTH=352 /DNA_ID=CAMNT_0023197839 /DNA_START=161 /DNA_END=1216 /DNA_ORIENTATION=-
MSSTVVALLSKRCVTCSSSIILRHRISARLLRGSTVSTAALPLPAGAVLCDPRHETTLTRQHRTTPWQSTPPTTLPTTSRSFSSSSSNDRSSWGEEYLASISRRNKNIRMHPDGHGRHILPGKYVIKNHPRTGAEKRVFLEHALGYFWAFKELTITDNKPILSNETIIPAAEAEKFPPLNGCISLHDEEVDVPEFFSRDNLSKDANAKCTLVAISCKDFGAQLLPSWTEPFERDLCTNNNNKNKDANRYEVVRITINEGRIAKLLSPFIVSGTKKKVPEKDHENTLLYYGDAEETRDVLRMHNIYTGYVFLVDGIGRVRWAGSGEGSEEEVRVMMGIARDLTVEYEKKKKNR